MKIIVFLGYSNSGKTYAIVSVVKELSRRGMRVGTLKHIHEPDFTIDTEGKDTWRHASAGASTVVALAPKELTIIEKGDTTLTTIDDLVGIFRKRRIDYLMVEGLYRRLSRRRGVVRVLCARTKAEALELLKVHPRPVCVISSGGIGGPLIEGLPLLRLPGDLDRLMELIG